MGRESHQTLHLRACTATYVAIPLADSKSHLKSALIVAKFAQYTHPRWCAKAGDLFVNLRLSAGQSVILAI